MKTPVTSAAVYRDGSHTCIFLSETDKLVAFISMDTLKVEAASTKTFHARWAEYPEYPVRRAAELYLACAAYRSIDAKTREHLSAIVASKATLYPPFDANLRKSTMAKKTPVTPQTEAKPAANPFEALQRGKPVTSKLAAKAAAPAKAAKTAAPTKAAKAPAKAAAEPPHNRRATDKVAAPAKTTAAAGEKPARLKVADTAKYKVVDTSRVKRGFLAEYVEKAQAMKVFTRDSLEANWGGRDSDAKMGTYFPYCVGKGIFGAA